MSSSDAPQSWKPWDMGSVARVESVDRSVSHAALISQEQKQTLQKLKAIAEEKGYQEGFQAGQEAGKAEVLAQVEEVIQQTDAEFRQQAEAILDHLNHIKNALEEEMLSTLSAMSLAIGEQLAGRSLQVDNTQMVDLVKAALALEPGLKGNPVCHLHPSDIDSLEKHLATELEAAGWELAVDENISPGGFRVEAESGQLDAQVETRRERLEALIEKHMPSLSQDSDGTSSD